MENRTKIIGTIGPASEEKSILQNMILAGMDTVRLNFSHGTYGQFSRIIQTVRKLSKEMERAIAIIQDLQGPKIRLGMLPLEGIAITKGQTVILTISTKKPGEIPIQYQALPLEVKKGDLFLIDDGMMEFKVERINFSKTKIFCRVQVGGILKSYKGINVPTASLKAQPLTKKDRRDLDFGITHGVDYVALSFVSHEKNIEELKRLLKQKKSSAKVIAKIERREAVHRLEKIISAADAIMVARGDLGLEVPAEQVPLLQKKIIHLCNRQGKPVIVATQILSSMIENPRATRAEISDAATAIFDHSDSLMLSNETAMGKYPVEAVRTLYRVACAVEKDLKNHQHLLTPRHTEDMAIFNATCLNATKLAHDISSKFIVAITRSGYTAREIAKYRSFVPIIVFTPHQHVAREMALVWGVTHSFIQFIHLKNPLSQIRKTLLTKKLVQEGDEIVVCHAGFGRKEKLITTTVI